MTQFVDAPGVIDLSWGHPDPALLPVGELAEATASALTRYGPQMLAYGAPAGPPDLIEYVCERLAETDGRAPRADEVVITAGVSQGLDVLATLLLTPGEQVLVDVPTYHLALRILADHPVELKAVASDHDGVLPDSLCAAVSRGRSGGQTVRFLYTIPTFHNPTGRAISLERRRALVEMLIDLDLRVWEDDTYRELAYDAPPPASLWALAPAGLVTRLGSFSKVVSPALRVGFVTADQATAARLAASGLFDSGGGIAHFSACVLAEYALSGRLADHIDGLRAAYARKRQALLTALAPKTDERAHWTTPGGGYFAWLRFPEPIADDKLAAAARRHRVGFLPESRFHLGDGFASSAIRLSFSMYEQSELTEAARRVVGVLDEVHSSRRGSAIA
jgi:DNA-binding transcriptional MocR family regulator